MQEFETGPGQFDAFQPPSEVKGVAGFESEATKTAKKFIVSALEKSAGKDGALKARINELLQKPAPDLANRFGGYLDTAIANEGYGMTLLDALAQKFIESKQDLDLIDPVLERILEDLRQAN